MVSNDMPTEGLHFKLDPITKHRIDELRTKFDIPDSTTDDDIMLEAFSLFNKILPEFKPLVNEIMKEMAKEALKDVNNK